MLVFYVFTISIYWYLFISIGNILLFMIYENIFVIILWALSLLLLLYYIIIIIIIILHYLLHYCNIFWNYIFTYISLKILYYFVISFNISVFNWSIIISFSLLLFILLFHIIWKCKFNFHTCLIAESVERRKNWFPFILLRCQLCCNTHEQCSMPWFLKDTFIKVITRYLTKAKRCKPTLKTIAGFTSSCVFASILLHAMKFSDLSRCSGNDVCRDYFV